jgi:hypothetical protein
VGVQTAHHAVIAVFVKIACPFTTRGAVYKYSCYRCLSRIFLPRLENTYPRVCLTHLQPISQQPFISFTFPRSTSVTLGLSHHRDHQSNSPRYPTSTTVMPSRNLYVRASLDLVTPRPLGNADGNVFDKAFNQEMDLEEWNDWMRWEGGAELEFPGMDRRESSTSNISSPETWFTDVECLGRDAISTTYSTANEFPMEDAPFEFDDNPLSTTFIPSPTSTLFPTKAQATQNVQRPFRGYTSLTAAEEQSLQDIAMPYRMLSKIKIASVASSSTASHSSMSPSPSPEPEFRTRKRKNNKRKTSVDDEELPTALTQSRKRGHNAIEKRYRTNLNEKINCLRDGVPALCRHSSSESKSGDEAEDSDGEGVDSKTGQQKYGKAAVLTRALEYIQHLESTTQRLGNEVDVLKTRVGAFEKLAMSGSLILNGSGASALNAPVEVKSETLESIQAGKFISHPEPASRILIQYLQISSKSSPKQSQSQDLRHGEEIPSRPRFVDVGRG